MVCKLRMVLGPPVYPMASCPRSMSVGSNVFSSSFSLPLALYQVVAIRDGGCGGFHNQIQNHALSSPS